HASAARNDAAGKPRDIFGRETKPWPISNNHGGDRSIDEAINNPRALISIDVDHFDSPMLVSYDALRNRHPAMCDAGYERGVQLLVLFGCALVSLVATELCPKICSVFETGIQSQDLHQIDDRILPIIRVRLIVCGGLERGPHLVIGHRPDRR